MLLAGAAFARAASGGTAKTSALTLTAARGRLPAGRASQAVVEGAALAAYRFTVHKSTKAGTRAPNPRVTTVR